MLVSSSSHVGFLQVAIAVMIRGGSGAAACDVDIANY